jgi:hypothetical protein
MNPTAFLLGVDFNGPLRPNMQTRCWHFIGWNGEPVVGKHRLAWEVFHGPIPPGMLVLHSCDHGPCVNVHHLRLGTHADNGVDKRARARARKLKPEQVAEIIRRYRAWSKVDGRRALAAEFGVTPPTIHKVINRLGGYSSGP